MPHEGEFASYRPLKRVADAERVKRLLNRAQVFKPTSCKTTIAPVALSESCPNLPPLVLAVDGSYSEVSVEAGYPGATVGYVTVASVLLDLERVRVLDEVRPIDPREFRKTEQADTIDAAFPGSNVVTLHHSAARSSFRQELFDTFHDIILDEDDRVRLLETYEVLLAAKPQSRGQECPYKDILGCEAQIMLAPGNSKCPSCQQPLYSTDALRIHERFNDIGSNGEAFGLVMQVWERILLVHVLRCFERRNLLNKMGRLAFFLDGPLAVFGPPAWLSAAIQTELKRINKKVRAETGSDLIIVGIEKTGNFVMHFEEVDRTDVPGEARFPPRSYLLLTDEYIKERIVHSSSPKPYGIDTYFGRKMLYKTSSGARIVASIPFLTDEQETLADNASLYPQLGTVCHLLNALVCSRYPNALSPIVAAHAHAAIPLYLGTKVLKELAAALMGKK